MGGNLNRMTEIINGKNLDSILKYCIDIYETNNGYIFLGDIEEKVFNESLNEKEIELLINYIGDYKYKVLEILSDYNICICKNDLTEKFLNGGGFTKIETDLENEKIELNKNTKLDLDLKLLQKESIEYQNKFRNQDEKIRVLDLKLKRVNMLKEYGWLFGVFIIVVEILIELGKMIFS